MKYNIYTVNKNGLPIMQQAIMDGVTPCISHTFHVDKGDTVTIAKNGKNVSGVLTVPHSGTYQIQGQICSVNPTPPLSPEEEQENKDLLREYEMAIKQSKLQAFKRLPHKIREAVVDAINMEKYVMSIESATAEKSARLMELEKQVHLSNNGLNINFGRVYVDSHYLHNGLRIESGYHPIRVKLRENDIGDEEIIKAHAEACIEEAING